MEYRLAPRRYSAPAPENGWLPVRISEDLRKSVVFLGWQKAGPIDEAPIDPKGTAFFVTLSEKDDGTALLVTARHVAEKLHAPFVIRLNKKGGGAALHHIENKTDIHWCYHPTDPTIDIAVAPLALPSWSEGVAYLATSLRGADTEAWNDIGPGDDVFVIGLFHLHHGTRENLPIVHSGKIAMMPTDEKIPVDGMDREGYLVQANAISGCSGSPVYVIRSRTIKFPAVSFIASDNRLAMLGVWSSSWKVNRSEIVSVRTDDDDSTGTLAPLGMGIVTPGVRLAEILEGDELKRARQDLDKRLRGERSATPDSLSPTTEENPRQKEDFTSLVSAAAKKRPQAD